MSYQLVEPTVARWGASSRTTGTTKAWLVGWRRTVVARTVMVGSLVARGGRTYLRKRRRLLVRSAWYASAWTMWISEEFMTMATFLLLRSDLEAAGRRVRGADPASGGGALVS